LIRNLKKQFRDWRIEMRSIGSAILNWDLIRALKKQFRDWRTEMRSINERRTLS
jgi:hypothetical protein